MHELSIAAAVVEQAGQIAAREGAERVVAITVSVGSLSGVDPEALGFAFPFAAEGTVAGNARLSVEPVPAQLRCRACQNEWSPDDPVFVCAACGGTDVELLAGRELNIRTVELAFGG